MKTIILCGGIGYRLKDETEFKPKPMVAIGNKPILWHIMKIFTQYGFNDFIIALGYKGDLIKQFFLNQKYFIHDFTLATKSGYTKLHKEHTSPEKIDDFKITFVDTGVETLPGERILRLKNYIPEDDESFIVTYGDILSDIAIDKLVKYHRKQKTIGTISAVHPRSRFGMVEIDRSFKVKQFIEKPILDRWINGGYMVFKKSFFKYLKNNESDYDGIKRLVRKRQLSVFIHEGYWQSLDTYKDLDDMNISWKTQPMWKRWI